MAVVRRFLLASSLNRLIRRERGSARVTEGYFPSQSERRSHVHVEGGQCELVLVLASAGEASTEERTEVPRAHADALLEVCSGRAVYDRSRLTVASVGELLVDRFSQPAQLDVVSVAFEDADAAQGFQAPAWFGPEVTADPAYENRGIALDGVPAHEAELPLSNEALEALLDALENRFSPGRFATPQRVPADDARVMDALRRLAGGSAGATAAASGRAASPALGSDDDIFTGSHASAAVDAPAAAAERPAEEDPTPAQPAGEPEADETDRMDDVLQGLSQVLEAYSEPAGREPAPAGSVVEVDRWSNRARRSEG